MKKLFLLFLSLNSIFAREVFYVSPSDTLQNDLAITGQSCVIKGYVDGNVAVINGDLEVYGTVLGDVAVIGGDARLFKGCKIDGNFAVIGGKIEKEEGANIKGEIASVPLGPFKFFLKFIPRVTSPKDGKIEREKKVKVSKPLYSSFLYFIWGISLSLIILLLTAVLPSNSEKMAIYLEKKPWYSFLAGFLSEILFVPLILLLCISILGIPVIPFFVLAFILSMLLGLVPTSIFTGRIMRKSFSFLPDKNYLLSFLGLLLVFILLFLGQLLQIGNSFLNIFGTIVSVISFFILYLYFTFGLGSLILSRLGTRIP